MEHASNYNLNGISDGIELLFNKKKSVSGGSDISSLRGERKRFNPNDYKEDISVISDSIVPEVVECNVNDEDYGSEEGTISEIESVDSGKISLNRCMPESRPKQRYAKSEYSDRVEESYNSKKEILYQFERMEKKGITLPKKFSLSSDYDEMKFELNRIKRDLKLDSAIKFQRKVLMTSVNGIEILNNTFNPVGAKLNGWSAKVYDDLDDYDDIFEELFDKYKGKTSLPPEVRLMMSLGGSAFMYHMSNSFSNQLPGLSEILKNNPDLAKNLAQKTAEHMSNQETSANNLFGGLGSMFSGFFNRGQSPSQQPMPQQQGPRPNMRGPSNIDELLKRSMNNDNQSLLTDSEYLKEESDEGSSIGDVLRSITNSSSKNGKKRSITLDI
jgi:Family of unknown function (DUF5767)